MPHLLLVGFAAAGALPALTADVFSKRRALFEVLNNGAQLFKAFLAKLLAAEYLAAQLGIMLVDIGDKRLFKRRDVLHLYVVGIALRRGKDGDASIGE